MKIKLTEESLVVRHYLADALMAHTDLEPVSFHMPGHKYGRGLPARFLHMCEENNLGQFDVTELDGLDVLHYPKGVIQLSQQQYANFLKVNSVHYLVNGSSAGIIAAMLSVLGPGDRVIIPRNCHSSVIHGLILSGAEPLYYFPEVDSDTGLILGVSIDKIEQLLKDTRNVKAVILLNPNYYGICSDISAIYEVCRSNNAVLIVDEAHGSLFSYSSQLPVSGLELKVPLVIQSLHKTAGALTQCSIVCTGMSGYWCERLEQSLRMVQTTSPSYLLMASIEAALCQLIEQGSRLAEGSLEITTLARRRIVNETNIKVLAPSNWDKSFLDGSRLLLSARHLGYSGHDLAKVLQREKIFVEMSDDNVIVLMLSWANTNVDVNKLIEAFNKLPVKSPLPYLEVDYRPYLQKHNQCMSPREAWFAPKEKVQLKDAIGKVAAQVYAPCPPGIPIMVPGELITEVMIGGNHGLEQAFEIEVVARR